MLRELRIDNIAVIEHAEISFSPGLNVLTGETGAGKSMIIDAIGAVTGERVSRELVRSGADFAEACAVFDAEGAEDWLRENELETDEEELIVRRRITKDGKSSCRVGGVPVTAAQLKSLGAGLLEIHGQNDGLRLLDEKMHLSALDRFAGLDTCPCEEAYRSLQSLKKEKKQILSDLEEKERLQELLEDSIRELEQAGLREGEEEELRSRRELLRNSEKLTEALQGVMSLLDGEEGAESLTAEALRCAGRAVSFVPELKSCEESLRQASLLLDDAAETARDFWIRSASLRRNMTAWSSA